MRQFILTLATAAAALASCWELFQGISAVIRGELENSLYHIFLTTPVLLGLAVTFDHVNAQLHDEYRRMRRALRRRRGTQIDVFEPESRETKNTPWEDDSSHTR